MGIRKVIIIGAGPAGLATAGRLRKEGIEFELLEASPKVAWAWHNHYDRLHLHTVGKRSHLPFLEFPENFPNYVPREKLAEYYEEYAKKFELNPKLNQEVKSIAKVEDGWQVNTQNESYRSEHVVLATGINRIPIEPIWPGIEGFKGNILHSREYKNPKPFLNSRTLVVGMGNTGAEVALDLVDAGVETYLSVRSAVTIVPRDVFGTPSQITGQRLEKLPFGIGNNLGMLVSKLFVGNLKKYGLRTTNMPPVQLLKETGRTPVMDLGTVKAIKQGRIKIVKAIDSFDGKRIHFASGTALDFDNVILCTGYKAQLADFISEIAPTLDKHQLPSSAIGSEGLSGIYFVGFDNYQLGGILGAIYRDSEVVSSAIKKLI